MRGRSPRQRFVEAALGPRTAAKEPPHGLGRPNDGPVQLERVLGIRRTGRLEPAAIGEVRAEGVPIQPEHPEQWSPQQGTDQPDWRHSATPARRNTRAHSVARASNGIVAALGFALKTIATPGRTAIPSIAARSRRRILFRVTEFPLWREIAYPTRAGPSISATRQRTGPENARTPDRWTVRWWAEAIRRTRVISRDQRVIRRNDGPRSGRKASAALRAATSDDGAASVSTHARTETEPALTPAIAGLVGTFHGRKARVYGARWHFVKVSL